MPSRRPGPCWAAVAGDRWGCRNAPDFREGLPVIALGVSKSGHSPDGPSFGEARPARGAVPECNTGNPATTVKRTGANAPSFRQEPAITCPRVRPVVPSSMPVARFFVIALLAGRIVALSGVSISDQNDVIEARPVGGVRAGRGARRVRDAGTGGRGLPPPVTSPSFARRRHGAAAAPAQMKQREDEAYGARNCTEVRGNVRRR